MALYQPSYLSPRNSTIDCTIEEQLEFSCRLQGNSLLYGYDITIYNADTNAQIFKLSSNESKSILIQQRDEKDLQKQKIESQLQETNELMVEYGGDESSLNYVDKLNENRRTMLELLEKMRECLAEGSITEEIETEFFGYGDEIMKLIDENTDAMTGMQSKIENHYKNVDESYQKRIANNKLELSVYRTKYNTQKGLKPNKNTGELEPVGDPVVNEKTVTIVETMIDFSTDNVSTFDSSSKRIISEYWTATRISLQNLVDELTAAQTDLQARLEYLNTAIDRLSDGMFVLADPLYPVDYLGNNTILKHTLPPGILNNGGNYKWKITLFWSSTNNPENLDLSIDSYESYFECRTMPTVSVENWIPKVDKKYYEFIGKYEQREYVPITYFRWILINETTGQEIEDTGYIPSTDLRYYYDGFMNEYTYSIQLFVRNQNGIEVHTEPQRFKISYVGMFIDNLVRATSSTDEHGIIVSWAAIHGVSATLYGDYTYQQNLPVFQHTSITLPRGTSIVFDKDNDDTLRIPAVNATHIYSTRIDEPTIETLYEATGSNGGLPYYKRLTLEGTTLIYDINGQKQIKKEIIPDTLHWYVIVMKPDKLYVSQKWATGLFPKEDLAPESYLYPHLELFPQPLVYHNTEGEVFI